jgi:hypothetical protein
MTTEELAAAGIQPTEGNVPNSENVSSRPAAETIHNSGSRKDGEIRSENRFGSEGDLSNVDADISELVVMKDKSYPLAFVFGESKVMADLIKEYEKAGFFPVSDGHPTSGEQVSTPKANEVVVSMDFFTCRLRYSYGPILPSILEKFSAKMHQLKLTPNSFWNFQNYFRSLRPSSVPSMLTYSLVYLRQWEVL